MKMDKVTATKKINQVGNSLTINVTKESKMLGLGRGDLVTVELKGNPAPYMVQDKETGTKIDGASTLNGALRLVASYESMDKRDGIYTPNFYEIVKWNGTEYEPI